MPTFNELLSQIKDQIREVSVEETKVRCVDCSGDGPVLVDCRERDEYDQGFIPRATWIPRGFLELKIEDLVPEPEAPPLGGNAPSVRGRRQTPPARA